MWAEPMAKYFTEEFFQELAQKLNADEGWRKKAGSLTLKIVNHCTDQGQSFLLEVRQGQVTARSVSPAEPADFKFEGTYDNWVKYARGESDLATQVMTGRIRFRGSVSKIMSLQDPLNHLAKVAQEIPKKF